MWNVMISSKKFVSYLAAITKNHLTKVTENVIFIENMDCSKSVGTIRSFGLV